MHFAVVSVEVPGHVNPMCALTLELQRRGHEISWIGTLDGVQRAEDCGFNSRVIAPQEFPLGTYPEITRQLSQLSGIRALRYTLFAYRKLIRAHLSQAPQAIRSCGAQALIMDETVFSNRTVAEIVGLPWVTLCCALPLYPDPDLPPPFLGWRYVDSRWGRLRNRFGYYVGRRAMRHWRRVIQPLRVHNGLSAYDSFRESASQLATIANTTEAFDFPRKQKPDWFHYVGSFHDQPSRRPINFPWDRLDGRKMIYASLGTQQTRLLELYHRIAEACVDLPVQLVISMGGGELPERLGELPGDPIVVHYAPQIELMERSSLVITHAGMNTTSEAIAHNCPMVAIPITNDQPAVAARIARAGCGQVVPLRSASAAMLKSAIENVLSDASYRENAQRLGDANRYAGGVATAADIVERVMCRES